MTPTTARSFAHEICRSPGTTANRNVPSCRFTTRRLHDVGRRDAENLGGLLERPGAVRSTNSTAMPRAAASASTAPRADPPARSSRRGRRPSGEPSGTIVDAATLARIAGERPTDDTTTLQPAPACAIGPLELDVAGRARADGGITNTAFRRLCREYGAGLYVSEMITSRALVERTPESMRLITHHESETPRSIQLYGVDPKTVAEAVTMLVAEDRADHIDLNFGCPVPKVTRKGGGAALPWKLGLFREIVERAVQAAGDIPLTIKMRKGIDADHLTYLEAGRAAEGAGVASIALHARTAAEFYSRHGRLVGDREAQGDRHERAGARQRRHLERRRRAAHGRRDRMRRGRGRSRLPRAAVAVRRPRGGVPRRGSSKARADARRGRATRSSATPNCWSSSSTTRTARAATSASTSPGTSRATRSAASCVPRSRPSSQPRTRSTTCSASSTGPAVPRRRRRGEQYAT